MFVLKMRALSLGGARLAIIIIYFASRCCALHLSSTHIVVNTYLSDFFPPKVIIFKKFYSKLNNNLKKKITEEPLRVSRTA